jgi:hypothetical protein
VESRIYAVCNAVARQERRVRSRMEKVSKGLGTARNNPRRQYNKRV